MSRSFIGYLLILLSLLLTGLVLWPKMQDVRAATVNRDALREVVETKQTRLESLQKLNSTFKSNTERISRLVSALPQEPEVPEVLVALEAMIGQSGVTVTSISPQVHQRDSVVLTTITGTGVMAEIERFASLVAANDRPMSLRTIVMTEQTEGSEIRFTATLEIPYVPVVGTKSTQRSQQ